MDLSIYVSMPILVKSNDVRSRRKARAHHGWLRPARGSTGFKKPFEPSHSISVVCYVTVKPYKSGVTLQSQMHSHIRLCMRGVEGGGGGKGLR